MLIANLIIISWDCKTIKHETNCCNLLNIMATKLYYYLFSGEKYPHLIAKAFCHS